MDVLWLLQTITIIDVIDILLLSYIIYRALLIIEGTRALQSLAGLFFVVGLYALSGQIGLTGVFWLLDKFIVYLVLAIIILFQEDIRKGLARAGQLIPTFKDTQDVSTLEIICKTSFALANRRIGALIVLEANVLLTETVQSGLALNADLSQELLTAIFLPTSPLHDGAVIVRDSRVLSAKSILPISKTSNISKFYGTRHRSAIGLSEQSDATIIVISEERGTIALVRSGEMEIVTNVKELRALLQQSVPMLEVDT